MYVEKEIFNIIKHKRNVIFNSECKLYPTDQNDLMYIRKWRNYNLIDTITS